MTEDLNRLRYIPIAVDFTLLKTLYSVFAMIAIEGWDKHILCLYGCTQYICITSKSCTFVWHKETEKMIPGLHMPDFAESEFKPPSSNLSLSLALYVTSSPATLFRTLEGRFNPTRLFLLSLKRQCRAITSLAHFFVFSFFSSFFFLHGKSTRNETNFVSYLQTKFSVPQSRYT